MTTIAISAAPDVPHLDFDPFSIEFFADPFPTHEKLREAGPVVYLDKWGVYGVARYEQVHAVLNDPQTLCAATCRAPPRPLNACSSVFRFSQRT